MDTAWDIILFASKWLFIGLIYLVLFIVVLAVRREMALRVEEKVSTPVAAAGRLRVVSGGSDTQARPGRIFTLPNQATLGADPANELPFTDQYLSSHHTRLRWDGAQWWVEDLDSKNGTFVDGRPAPANRPQPIPFGSKLEIGDMVFELLA